jgi:hypothetical protein
MWSRKSLKWVDLGRLNYEDLRGERDHISVNMPIRISPSTNILFISLPSIYSHSPVLVLTSSFDKTQQSILSPVRAE